MSKNYSIEKQIYFGLNKIFKEDLDTHFTSQYDTEKERLESLKRIGKHYDSLFEDEAGISIEEFTRTHSSFRSFSQRIASSLGEKPETKRLPSKKSQIEKLEDRIEAGDLLAEKGLAFSLLHSGQDSESREIDMSYKAFWIGDCIARALVDKHGIPKTEEEKKFYYWNNEELKKAEKYLAALVGGPSQA